MQKLRKVRVAVSIFFLVITALVFLDITHNLKPTVFNIVLYLQLVPSILKYFNSFLLISTGFILVLIITILFGRVYCSSVCPIGTIQDIISRLSKKVNRRKKYNYSKQYAWIQYSILSFTIISFFLGGILLLNLLDPYSNAGRIFSQIVNPILIFFNNSIASLLELFNVYLVYPIDPKKISIGLILFPIGFLIVLFVFSFLRGRLYCNTICPVGTLLGLISKVSLFKLKIDLINCESCGACEKVCKSECIDFSTKSIDFDRCVLCFNCIDICPSNVINFELPKIQTKEFSTKTDESKRNFLASTFIYSLGLAGINYAQIKIKPEKESTKPVYRKFTVTPPGSHNLEKFNNSCTACGLCVSACPSKVLQPSYLQYGFLGILQPYMDFYTSYCNYDCTICTDTCPTGAILPLTKQSKKVTQIGKAIFIKENCIVETEKKDCGACSEHCPTKAVDMVPFKDNLKIPEVTDKYCIGCGACEFACPTKPYKSIYVEGNAWHKVAELQPVKKIEEKIDLKEEFPF